MHLLNQLIVNLMQKISTSAEQQIEEDIQDLKAFKEHFIDD